MIDALHIPADFWDRDDVQVAVTRGSLPTLLRLARVHCDASQTKIAAACDLSQSDVSRIMNGRRVPRALPTLKRIAAGLGMPDHARIAFFGLAQLPAAGVTTSAQRPRPVQSTDPGPDTRRPTLLATLLTVSNLTYETAAEHLGITSRHLARLARGERHTRPEDLRPTTRHALTTFFGRPVEDLLRPCDPAASDRRPEDLDPRTGNDIDHFRRGIDRTLATNGTPITERQPEDHNRGVDRRRVITNFATLAFTAAHPRLSGLARALTDLTSARPADTARRPVSVAQLARSTATAKRLYQTCRYGAVLTDLPDLLDSIRAACAQAPDSSAAALHAIAADAYQVAGSVLLKFGDGTLAAVAADRSMNAAARSQNPITLAASARILTHTLMTSGHPGTAKDIATRAAENLAKDPAASSPEGISVLGALLLRGAIAAARNEDRAGTGVLIEHAQQAARQLGRDANAYWTAFGPTNVQLHQLSAAVLLGDAGTAIDLAGRIDVSHIALPERRAALFLDTSQAYLQWGKYDRAYNALMQAMNVAPEEVRSRPTAHQLVAQLAQQAPTSTRSKAIDLSQLIGIDL